MTTAAQHIDDAVRAFTLNYGDTAAHLKAGHDAEPGCVMADLLQAWLLTLSNDGVQVAKARDLLATIGEDSLSGREAAHLEDGDQA